MRALAFVLVWLAQPLIVAYYREPRLSEFIFWLASPLFIRAIGQQFGVLLRKELAFRSLTLINLVVEGVSASLAIGLALNGGGVWTLVWRQVSTAVLSSAAFIGVLLTFEIFCRQSLDGERPNGLDLSDSEP